MEGIEVVGEIKSKAVDPKGMAAVFSDRIFVKPTDPKWKEFPAVCMPKAFLGDFERTKNFKIYEDDVWLIGFPRSGTTLVQEMMWLMMNDYNYEGAKSVDTYNRAQWFDFFNVTHPIQGVDVGYQDRMPRPRIYKCHYPVQFLPDQIWTVKPKIVHIVRDLKDVAISYYYLRKNQWHEDIENIEDHFEDMFSAKTWYTPYREHIENYKRIPDYPNIFYMTYEGLMADKPNVTRKLAEFLGKPISDENLDQLLDHCKFEKMRENKATNMIKYMELFNQLSNHDRPVDSFVRKGIVGDHKNQMSEATIKRFNEWMAEAGNLKCGF
ncbi:hypothetical protein ACKWTF_015344 [Chironomus riparius]